MKLFLSACCLCFLLSGPWVHANAFQEQDSAGRAFKAGNELMSKQKPGEALLRYKEALAIQPNDTSILYNAGLAAYLSKDYPTAADLWKKLIALDPEDWRTRAKLVQVYQAMGNSSSRDAERAELLELRKAGKNEELAQAVEYCRDQFEVNGIRVMAFEHFELKGDHALRYVFSILNEDGNKEKYRLSLGSYEATNAIWRETTKPTPKQGERLFHLDGYYDWGHATYDFFAPEPSYETVKAKVVRILEGKDHPASTTVVNRPQDQKQ